MVKTVEGFREHLGQIFTQASWCVILHFGVIQYQRLCLVPFMLNKLIFLSTFQHFQVVQDAYSYKWLPWQQYLASINFTYTFRDIHTYIPNTQTYDQYFKNARSIWNAHPSNLAAAHGT